MRYARAKKSLKIFSVVMRLGTAHKSANCARGQYMRVNTESQEDFRPGPRRNRTTAGTDPYAVFRDRVQRRLLTDLSPVVDTNNVVEVRRALEHIFNETLVEERLPISRTEDGSRVNVIIPPLALNGPTISIRKFAKAVYGTDDLLRLGALTEEMAEFFQACVVARLNIIISGGTSTGKTTLLNILSGFLPERERIVTIEDSAELQLHQRHVVRLEARPPNVEGRGEVTIRQLVINALRMRPDRIVVGEVRGGEALDMLQAMNTGHDGSLTTAHSNSPRDTLHRIETMALMTGMDLPLHAVRAQLASAFDLIVHLERLMDGTRRIVQVSEVQGMEGNVIVMQDIFSFIQTGVKNGRVEGHFAASGVRPRFMDKIEAYGLFVPPATFAPGPLGKRKAGRR